MRPTPLFYMIGVLSLATCGVVLWVLAHFILKFW